MTSVTFQKIIDTDAGNTITAQILTDGNGNVIVQNEIDGNGGDDTLTAVSGDNQNVVVGGHLESWTNTLNGGAGNDTLNGGDGQDTLNGGDGNDTLNGGAGNDTLNGNAGANTLHGDAGNDILFTAGGDVLLDGGADDDSLAASGDVSGTTITAIEHLLLGNGADITITADQVNAFVDVDYNGTQSGAGFTLRMATAGTIGSNFVAADNYGTIMGSAGADVINVSTSTNVHGWTLIAGHDPNITGGDNVGGNVLTGGSANDTLISGIGGDTLNGGAGNDTLTGNGGDDILNGGDDNDTLSGGDGNDTLNGGAGNDTLNGNAGANTLHGDAGNDILFTAGGDVLLDGGADDDSLAASGDVSGTTITAIEHLLLGNGADITITADQVNAFVDVDYNGTQSGAGFTLRMATAGTIGSNFVAADNYGTIMGSAGADVINVSTSTNVHGWTLIAGHDPNITGGDNVGGNVLTGGSANDTLISGIGGDTLNGGAGNDTLTGNGGDDILNGGDDNDTLSGGDGNDTLNGGAGNDTLNGNAGANTLHGDAGNDILFTAGGDVLLDGGADDDSLAASGDVSGTTITAIEHLLLGNGADITITADQVNAFVDVDYNGTQSGAGFTLRMATAGTIGSNFVAADNYGTIMGSAGADVINVSTSTNVHGWTLIAGHDPNITGGDNVGGNVLTGGSANDTLISGIGGDTLNGGAGNDTLTGNGGDDILNGGDDNDTLSGGDGNDTLNGGAGNDTLNGGAGADHFVYTSGQDLITDFHANEGDRIDLSQISGTATFSDLSEVISQSGGNTVIDFGDGNTLTLSNVTAGSLLAVDFTLASSLPPAHPSDMDGDGVNDLVFQSHSTVDTLYASMPAGTLVDDIFPALSGVDATQIRAAGTGDVDGSGSADVVFQIGDDIVSKAAGDIATTFGPMVFAVPDGWTVSGVGDVNGDGAADILITDATNDAGKGDTFFIDAKASYATLATATPHAVASNLATPGADYVVRGIGDINGDGVNDVVFQSAADGDVIYADMAAVAQHVAVNNFSLNDTLHQVLSASVINASLVVKAVGDLDGDGLADLVVEQETDPNAGPVHSLVLEAHNGGGNAFTFQTAGTITDYAAFDVKGIADVNGDGIGDILMQYTQDLPFGGANLHGAVIVVDPALGASAASIALVNQTLSFGDYVLV